MKREKSSPSLLSSSGKPVGYSIALILENSGIIALPVPDEPYEYWDEENKIGKGIQSLKEAGYYAGLGVIGKNGLSTQKGYLLYKCNGCRINCPYERGYGQKKS